MLRTSGKFITGRQIIAVMYESLDMIATLGYLIKIQYQRDEKMNTFKQTWLEVTSEVIGLMRPEDVLSDTALRDTLHSKIKESPALKMEIFVYYDMLNYDDPKRSYQTLLSLMGRCIRKQREQRNLHQTQIGLQQMVQGKDQKAVLAKSQGGGKDTAVPARKKGGKPKNEEAAWSCPKAKRKLMQRPSPERVMTKASKGKDPNPPLGKRT